MAGWYIRRGEKIVGPVELPKLQELVAAGRVVPTDQIAKEVTGPWKEAGETNLFAKPKQTPVAKLLRHVEVSCPSCSSVFRVAETIVGKRCKCSKCGHPFVVQLGPPPVSAGDDSSSAVPPPPKSNDENMPPVSIEVSVDPTKSNDQWKNLRRTTYARQNLLPDEEILYVASISPYIFALAEHVPPSVESKNRWNFANVPTNKLGRCNICNLPPTEVQNY